MLVVLLGVGPRRLATRAAWLTLALAGASLMCVQTLAPQEAFFGLIVVDEWAQAFRWFALGAITLVSLMVSGAHDIEDAWRGECLGLLLFVGVGLMLMAQAQHLLMAYLAIEMVSMISYVLVALARDARGSEAALKYLLFGALCSGIMLFGMSLLFGLTGEMSFPGLGAALVGVSPPLAGALSTALALILVGLAFKISLVPFPMWTPDVYQGAPASVTREFRAVPTTDLAGHIGKTVRLHLTHGATREGRLLRVLDGMARVERRFPGGVMTLAIPLRQIERVEVLL
jgi:NADH-quinone oxidoreductase subunit N